MPIRDSLIAIALLSSLAAFAPAAFNPVASAQAQTIAATRTGSPTVTLTAGQLAALPPSDGILSMGNPPVPHRFQGPLLWTVLGAAGLVDAKDFHPYVHETLRVQGADGYVAILALGEIAPQFEGKPVIVALTEDGKNLPLPRLVVPRDSRAGRSVRDVVSLTVDDVPQTAATPPKTAPKTRP